MLTFENIRSFPKVELHCHLDGSIRPETLQKIAKAQNMSIADDLEIVKQNMQAPKDCQHLEDYLAGFIYVLPYLQTSIGLEMAAFDVMEQAFLDGIVYIEIRFAPSLSLEKGLSVPETIQAVAKGIAQAEEKYPVKGNILISGMRDQEQEYLKDIFFESLNTVETKVVGIDLAGAEKDNSVSNVAEVIQVTTDQTDISLTLHAGECGCVQNIKDSVALGATRIGHSIALLGDEESQEWLSEKDVCIEGCPTSNVDTRMIKNISEYPLHAWLEKGLTFCINTDNRTVSNTTLTNEYYQLVNHCGLTVKQLCQLNQNGANYAFIDEEYRANLVEQMERFEC